MANFSKTWPTFTSVLVLTACLNMNGMIVSHAGETQKPQSDYYRETIAGNYLASRFAQNNNDWQRASSYINRLTASDPENGTLQQRAMILAMGSGDVQNATKHARIILKDEPDNFWALMFANLEAILHDDYENAQTILNEMPDDGIANYVAPLLNIWSNAGQEKLETTLSPGNSLELIHTIYAADYLGKTNVLDQSIIQQVQTAPLDLIDKEKIADIFARSNFKDEAIALYSSIENETATPYGIAEKIQRLENNEPLAEKNKASPFSSPKDGMSSAYFDIARILYREQNDETAQIFANMALGLQPNRTAAKILLAHIQTRNERYDDAYAYYESISADDPLYLGIQYQAAELLLEMEEYDKAIEMLEALYNDHNDVKALVQIGDVYRTQGDHKAAVKTYDRAFKYINTHSLDPELKAQSWIIYYARGMSYEQLKDWPKAEADLRKALDDQPDHAYLLNYLGYSMADRNVHLDEALDMIKKAAKLRPRDGYIIDSLGWVYYRLGRYDEAVSPLEKAVSLMPYDPTINDHLGDAYWQVGRKHEARFQWRRALNHVTDESHSESDIDTIKQKLKYGLNGSITATTENPEQKKKRALNP